MPPTLWFPVTGNEPSCTDCWDSRSLMEFGMDYDEFELDDFPGPAVIGVAFSDKSFYKRSSASSSCCAVAATMWLFKHRMIVKLAQRFEMNSVSSTNGILYRLLGFTANRCFLKSPTLKEDLQQLSPVQELIVERNC